MRRLDLWLVAVLVCGCGGSSESTVDPPSDGEVLDSALDDGGAADADDVAITDSSVTDGAASDSSASDTARSDGALSDGAKTETAADAPSPPTDVGTDAPACSCPSYTNAASAGTISNAALNEISGLASSKSSPGVIWTHNDSGDSARLFAIDTKGAFLGELTVTGATAVDWEDIAVGPCAAGSCIYVGDFGDNAMARDNDALYRIVEPQLDAKPFTKQSVAAEKIPFAYPDGKWNAEALLVHPTTGEIVIVTKGGSPGIYRFPSSLVAGTKVTLTKVGVPAGLDGVVTGGDVSPCGDRALLRTYASLFEYRIADLVGGLAAGLATAPTKVPVGSEGQGEAVTYRLDGRGYFTASEGTNVALFGTACK